MIRVNDLNIPLEYDGKDIKKAVASKLKTEIGDGEIKIIKRSVDARKKDNVHFDMSVALSLKNESTLIKRFNFVSNYNKYVPKKYDYVKMAKRPVVVGSGPAGLFAALVLAQAGAKPILIERGKSVDERKKAVEGFWHNRIIDAECNVQFGEGGAGTFSDGKLTTGTKDKRVAQVFHEFVENGAPSEILWLGKPHIGTDKLMNTVKNIRNKIISLGGEVFFNTKFVDFKEENNVLRGISVESGNAVRFIDTDNVILAIGHSARDVFKKLYEKNVSMTGKNFAMGVRIEHLQADINKALYGDFSDNPALSAADYKLVAHLPTGRSIYTFCMCPGGQVVASASEPDTVVTNGMSLFARDNTNANSALLVGISTNDFGNTPLGGMYLQQKIEHAAFVAGGGSYNAPVTLVSDFLKGSISKEFGKVKPSYLPDVTFAKPESYLPDYIVNSLRDGIPLLAQKLSAFADGDAVITGAESRSSSPVRITRGENCCSLSIDGLYPCGEGAGYAGGIVSAAVDGIRCAEAILGKYSRQ